MFAVGVQQLVDAILLWVRGYVTHDDALLAPNMVDVVIGDLALAIRL